jgi:hypothetical protein
MSKSVELAPVASIEETEGSVALDALTTTVSCVSAASLPVNVIGDDSLREPPSGVLALVEEGSGVSPFDLVSELDFDTLLDRTDGMREVVTERPAGCDGIVRFLRSIIRAWVNCHILLTPLREGKKDSPVGRREIEIMSPIISASWAASITRSGCLSNNTESAVDVVAQRRRSRESVGSKVDSRADVGRAAPIPCGPVASRAT